MKIYTPSKEQALLLVEECTQGLPFLISKETLPPKFILVDAVKETASQWIMPRLLLVGKQNAVVGTACFKSVPVGGKVEIGFGIAPGYRGNGYATEGVRLLLTEAFSSEKVLEVIAESAKTNQASRRVMEKCGFIAIGESVDECEATDVFRIGRKAEQTSTADG